MAGILPRQQGGILSLQQKIGRIGQLLSTYGEQPFGVGARQRAMLPYQWNQQEMLRGYYNRQAEQGELKRKEYERKMEAQRQEQQRLETFVSILPPEQQQAAMINPNAFAKPPTVQDPYIKMGTDTLLDRKTMQPVWQAKQSPKERRIVQGADSYKYYEDTGERVFSGVKKEQPYRTRDLSLLGGMVQPQEQVNGEWVSAGAPYSRRAATGSPVSPTKQDLERVVTMIETDPRFSGMGNSQEFAFAVSSKAREIMKDQKIGSYHATQKALDELAEQVMPGKESTSLFGWNWNPFNDPDTQFNPGSTQGNGQQGQTATNPQTGEQLIFRGGQWIPVQ